MKNVRLSWVIGVLLAGTLWAQTQPGKSTFKALPDFPPPPVPAGECTSTDPVTLALCNQAIQESYRYLISSYQHRRSSFDWNLAADKIIFAVVIVLVLSGLVFAAIQFRVALAGSPPPPAAPPADAKDGDVKEADRPKGPHPPGTPLATDLEISTTGLKVSSSVLGVVVLLISMAFFYLYARYVYPIQEVHHDQLDVSQGSSQ